MPDANPAQRMWDVVRSWFHQNAGKYVYEHIPPERTDTPGEQTPLEPYESYFRLWLAEMYLSRRTSWGRNWLPAVHSEVRLAFGGQQAVPITRVSQPPKDQLADGVRLNYQLTDLLPFNGGVVEIEASLLALQESDQLRTALGLVAGFSNLIQPPIGQALAIAEKVALGARDVFTAGQGGIHLGFHETLTSSGGGGQVLQPGYLAVLLATGDEVAAERLHVRDHRLYYQPAPGRLQLEPFDDADYLLLRVEGRTERDDWRLPDIQNPLDQAIVAISEGDDTRADAYRTVALAAAWRSADLARLDRRRVVMAIKEELVDLSTDRRGVTGRAARNLTDLVKARAIPRARAAAEGELTVAEVFA
jgi:hypothetical protein